METNLVFIAFAIGAYCVGSVSSAILICHLLKLGDPRASGSGNPGSTNVLRIGGVKAGLCTLIMDISKGFVPVFIASTYYNTPTMESTFIGLSAVLGHMFPLFFHFRGGKGVAAACGAIMALSPYLAASLAVIWLVLAVTTRFASLASVITALSAPILAWFWYQSAFLGLCLMALLIVYRHLPNIVNLLKGKENSLFLKNQ